MLWFKAFHIIAVVTWFAGLFYLPRLLVHHAEDQAPAARERLKIMERKLTIMLHIGGGLTVVLGIATLISAMQIMPGYFSQGWLHIKLLLVALLVIYHFYIVHLVKKFARDEITLSPKALRFINEIPGILLVAIVLLVVLKPF